MTFLERKTPTHANTKMKRTYKDSSSSSRSQIVVHLSNCQAQTAEAEAEAEAVRHTATHGNTLQHTATHCNTRQHTATHCNTALLARAVVRDLSPSASWPPHHASFAPNALDMTSLSPKKTWGLAERASRGQRHCTILFVAACCNVLQCVAVLKVEYVWCVCVCVFVAERASQ